jgi:chorismate synthase
MRKTISEARNEGDSVGGIVECVVRGAPAGLGNPIFDGVENRIAQLMFAVPAVKGIEFGAGFAAAGMHGSENNDEYCIENGKVRTSTNHAGGILGGITNGEEIVFRAAFKPTPSIAKPQRSVNLESMQPEILEITGRHDPCIVPRAVPVAEAVAAVALSDLILRGNDTWN